MQQPSLEPIITAIETYANQHKLNHRFVGGVSFGGLLNEDTIAQIDINSKTIILQHHNKEKLLRTDRTIRDIDLILFCNDKEKLLKFKQFLDKLRKETAPKAGELHLFGIAFPTFEDKSKKTMQEFPDVSVEPTIYPSFGKRNVFAQFVTALEVDGENQLYLAFDAIRQAISWESVEPWRVILDNGTTFTVRNPIADYYAYLFRSPAGPKPKDAEKLQYLKKLAERVTIAGKKHKPSISYLSQDYYGTWQNYIEKLHITSDPVISAKKLWLKVYWQTVGTIFAHTLSRYASNFTGVR